MIEPMAAEQEKLKRTPLYDVHVAAGARIVPFAGYEMPVQYEGVIAEHHAVRNEAGIFDVSHMGEVEFRGKGALEALDRLVTNDVSSLSEGKAQYALLCNEDGGIIDDLIIYCLERGSHYLVCVNAANASKDFAWMRERGGELCKQIEDTSSKWAQLALQGPLSERLLQSAFSSTSWAERLEELRFMDFFEGTFQDKPIIVSRSGYTGEDGFEIWLAPAAAADAWERLVAEGARPCGLGARDTLRLEMKYPLHGNDITEETSPVEAGLNFAVKLGKKEPFIGQVALQKQKEEGISRKLIGFELQDPGIARRGHPVKVDGEPFGEVTSGNRSPTLGKSIGLCYLPLEKTNPGTKFAVEVRGKDLGAMVVPTPFVSPHVKR